MSVYPPPKPRPGGLGEQVYNTVSGAIGGAIEGVAGTLRGIVHDAITGIMDAIEHEMVNQFSDLLIWARDLPGTPPIIKAQIEKMLHPTHFAVLPVIIPVIAAVLMALVMTAVRTIGNVVSYASERQFRTARLDPQTVVTALRRGLVNDAFASDELAELGYSDGRQDTIRRLVDILLAPGDVQEMVRRALISPENGKIGLIRQGYTDSDAANLIALANRLPDISLVQSGFLRGLVGEPEARAAFRSMGLSELWAGVAVATFAQVLNASTVYQAVTRGLATENDLTTDIRASGLNQRQLAAVRELQFQPLGLSEIMSLTNRGDISIEQARIQLARNGMRQSDIDLAIRLFNIIPGPADLVTMAVKEAFDDNVAAQYGTDEDFPPEFGTWAPRSGLTGDWPRRYWRAHWQLPSAGQGYDMLHRGIINQDELNTLLRTLDYMPYWRERLVRLNYNPFTRVDVRRMYQAGILSRDEVVSAYKDIGYDDAKAEKLTQFTIANAGAVNKDLTKAELLTGYKSGILNVDQLRNALNALGYQPDEVEYYVDFADYQLEQAANKDRIEIIHQRYIAGEIDENNARQQLTALQITSVAVDKYLLSWRAAQRVSPSKLSISQLADLWRKGIINTQQVRTNVSSLGYPVEQQGWLVESLTVAGAEKVRLPSLADLRSFYHNNIVTIDQFRAGLAALDYATEDIERYVKSVTIVPPTLPRLPSASELRGFYNAGAIDIAQYRTALASLGYSADVVQWFVITADNARVTQPKLPTVAELRAFLRAEIINIGQFQLGLAALGYSQTDIARYVALATQPTAGA